jgi:hypothetical protein
MARMLGIKQQMAYWLCQNGYLYTERLGVKSGLKNRDLGSRVRVEEVERFRREYVFGRDIAASLRTSSRRVGRILGEEGIFPIRGHTVIPPRMLIYPATEALRSFLATLSGVPLSGLLPAGKIEDNTSRVGPLGISDPVGSLQSRFPKANS